MRNILVVYHASCMDGFAAAWAAWHWLVKGDWDDIQFLQADYEDPIPDMEGKEVYIVDYSWKDVARFLEIASKAKKVVIIDHHVEANKIWANVELPEHIHYIYDVNASGCVLSWKYFQEAWLVEEGRKGNLFNIQGTPEILRNIQDRDLWRFDLPHSKQLHAYMKSCGFMLRERDQGKIIDQFIKFHDFYTMDTPDYNRFVEGGEVIMYAETVLIKSILERNMTMADFTVYGPKEHDAQDWEPKRTYNIPVAEMPYELASEAGHLMAEMFPDAPFTLTYETQWHYARYKISLRSKKDGGAHVGEIATLMGGGGHEHSAAWYQPRWQELPFDTV